MLKVRAYLTCFDLPLRRASGSAWLTAFCPPGAAKQRIPLCTEYPLSAIDKGKDYGKDKDRSED
ncbi:MAG: hypothetical protein ACOYOU_11515 [Kiritimatiellia bacterium]